MKFRFTLLLFILIQVSTSFAQVNTEKFRKYYDKEGFIYTLKTNFTYKSGNSEYGAINGLARIDYNGKKLDHFLVVDVEYKSSGTEKISNNGFIHLRSMWNFKPRTNLELFLQREYDEFIPKNTILRIIFLRLPILIKLDGDAAACDTG